MLSNLVRHSQLSNNINRRVQEWFAKLSDACLFANYATRGPTLRHGHHTVSWELIINRSPSRPVKIQLLRYRGRLSLIISFMDGENLLDYSPHGYACPSLANDWKMIKQNVPIADILKILRELDANDGE